MLVFGAIPIVLHTYALERPVRVLYLDGQSAALSVELGGTQSAELLLGSKSSPPHPSKGLQKSGHQRGPSSASKDGEPNWWDDYDRAVRLCQWAKQHGSIIEAFVRMNTVSMQAVQRHTLKQHLTVS